jgi:NADPH-dependent 2,4-dienoyl-CoA reductase/sulfur reductase-like enzyme
MSGTGISRFFLLRSMEDARRIGDALREAREAVIIGASFIGLEAAASLRKRGIQVQVAAPERALMEKSFGERVGARLRKLHEAHGVRFNLGVYPKEVREQDGKVKVTLSDGGTVQGDLVIAGVGVEPAVGFLEGSGLIRDGAVPVDSALRAGNPHVYAAGDIALVPDPITGEPRRVEHWVEAQRQGRHAARSMMGHGDRYREVPFFWTRQHDTTFTYQGYAGRYDRVVYRGEPEAGSFMAGYYLEGRLHAVLAAGMTGDFLAAGEIIKAGARLEPERLTDAGRPLRELLGR